MRYGLHWTPSLRERAIYLAADQTPKVRRRLNRDIRESRLDGPGSDSQRLATVHVLHYLSESTTAGADTKESSGERTSRAKDDTPANEKPDEEAPAAESNGGEPVPEASQDR